MWWFVYGFFAEAGFGKDGEVIGCLGLTLWYREVRMLNMLGIGRRSMLSTRIRCVVVKGGIRMALEEEEDCVILC